MQSPVRLLRYHAHGTVFADGEGLGTNVIISHDVVGAIVGAVHMELREHGRRNNLVRVNFKGKDGI